jgi:uncharacterized protein YbjT (DUF2867 family)
MSEKPLIAVCGATGQQGRTVIASLLARQKFAIRGLSRQPDGDAARKLRDQGVTIVRADLDDPASLTAAFAGAHGVFGVTQPWDASYRRADPAREIAQGRHIAGACETNGTRHLVLSTSLRVSDKKTGIPHADSKIVIEDHVMSRPLPWTILRPGTFMDNIGRSFFAVKKGTIKGFTDGDAKLPWVCCRDIGEAAATVFEQGERWTNKAIALIGAFASCDELAAELGRLRGKTYRYKSAPAWLMRLFVPEFYKMRRAFETVGRPPYPHRAAIDEAMRETRALVPDAWGLPEYLRHANLSG